MRKSLCTLFATLACSNVLAADPACTPITAVPAVITAPGSYCVIGHLVTSQASGAAIEIQADDVVLDMTQGGVDGSAGGPDSTAAGIYALDRNNITIMGGSIMFFAYGILLENSAPDFSNTRGHRVSDMLVDVSRRVGIEVRGVDTVLTRNLVSSTGTGGDGSIAAILAWGAGAVVFQNNIVSNETRVAQASATAIQVYGSAGCDVSENRIVNTSSAPGTLSVGVIVWNSVDCAVRDNEIDNRTTLPLEIGVYMPGSEHVQAISNKMTNVNRHYAR
jgi:hypothetical protein